MDYITRLEQGRATAPSGQVVAALARALQLDTAERDHLYRSAGLLPPRAGQMSTHIPSGVQRLISRLGDIPLAVFAADWSLVSWTPLWAALVGDPMLLPVVERNLVHLTFLSAADSPSRSAMAPIRSESGHAAVEAALVSDLRVASSVYPHEQRLTDLIARALATSPRFARMWASSAVGTHTSDRKTITHPHVGDICVDCDILTVPGADLKMVVYTVAADTPDAEKLDFLRVMGAHTLPGAGPASGSTGS